MLRTISRPLDVHRWCDYSELNNCLTDLMSQVDALGSRHRGRKAESAKSLRNALRSLVLDLYVAWKTDPQLEVGVPLSNRAFNRNSRYRALFLKYEGFTTAYRGLKELGYLEELRPGFNDVRTGKSFVTRARATPKLITLLTESAELSIPRIRTGSSEYAAETIILRDSQKRNMEYEDTAKTVQMRVDLSRINAALDRTWVDLYLTDAEYDALRDRIRGEAQGDDQKLAGIDLTRRRLVRIFNNGSWEQGGRFYGGWWQNIPSEYRLHLMLNGKHTCEVDYSGMHVALLYAEVGAEYAGDAYDIGLPQIPREVIKRTFNKMINAEGRMALETGFSENMYGITWSGFLEQIRIKHAPIGHYLGTGYGRQLQSMDAEIANRVLLRMVDMGYPCLPVHDSFIAHRDMTDELTDIMLEEFARKTGRNAATKQKLTYLDTYIPDHNSSTGTGVSMTDWLDDTGPYHGYETRLEDWFNRS